MREWNASLRIHLDVAKVAVDNAESKATEAKILLDSGHPGAAAALAVIGQEETGKALLHTLIGFGMVPEDAIPEAIKLAKNHGRKQQLAMVGHVLAHLAPRIRPFVDDVSDDLEATEELLRRLLARIVPTLLNEVNAFFAERPDFENRLGAVAVDRALQDLKHRGLYVDVNDGRVISPFIVTAAEAAAALNDLRDSIEGIRLFTQVGNFSDDGVRVARAAVQPHLEMAKARD